ncbi:uncharacterized protein LOC132628648 [Lycium barbarum]|uniref:uncharacterized protein LOC132628648 n=1 Tax=Lycium barbarum TaxID=112863 RepID=UPI00293F5C8A|nr:uncharacterized protein LOC132628648 [Lycium barbarum]
MTTMPFTPIDGHVGASSHIPPVLNTNQIPATAHSIPSYPTLQNTHSGITIQPNITPLPTDKSTPITQIRPAVSFHTPVTPGTFSPYQEINHYEEIEKAWKAEQEKQEERLEWKMTNMLERSMRTTLTGTGLSYDDLCMHPNLDLFEGFKVPRFELFNGTSNPKAHLQAYCDQLVSVRDNQALIMRLFNRSLTREASELFTAQNIRCWVTWEDMVAAFMERFCFNMETVPDRYYLEKVK